MSIRPFTVAVPDTILDDLRERLARTRWPSEVEGAGWSMGTDPSSLRRLCENWAGPFDWRARERAINDHPQYITEIDGETIHFVHARAPGGDGVPLLVMNGWPSNFYECLQLVDPLTHGSPAFDVVIPSLPGFGFSSANRGRGLRAMADMLAELMDRLGYRRFIAHGGDVGAGVAEQLRCGHPDRLIGMHVTNLQGSHTVSAQPTPDEQAYLDHAKRWWNEEGGYYAIQRTKPQTLAYGLSDSPAGMAGWIIEKWRAWSDCDGELDRAFSLDDLCSILTIYWATNTISSSIRVYHHANQDLHPPVRRGPVPAAVAEFPGDVMPVVRSRAEAWLNLVQYTNMPRGGHFAALEAPDLLAGDLHAFARKVA